MDLRDYLRLIRQRWASILAFTLVGLGLAAGYTFLQTPQYEGRSQLFVSVKGGSSATDVIQGNTFAEKRVASYVNLATSTRVLQAVAEELRLTGGAEHLAGVVTASNPAQTVLINITAIDASPDLAVAKANSTARQLIRAVSDVEDASLVSLSIFEEAKPAIAPSTPRVPLNLATGLALGILIGLAFAVLREVLETRIRSKEDVERIVTAGILGTFVQDPTVETAPLVTQGDSFSHRAESFRQLRTHLHFTNITGGSQSVVVTSSIPGEGKTSTSVNLALMLAQSGSKVLLVDADLRRPRVAKYLGLEGSIGLSGVLSHSVAFEDATQHWGDAGELHVLTSGQQPPNPSELLGSAAMEKLISRMEAEYEVIIIDAPPLLPVTDPSVLGSMAGGVILVVSADGGTRRGELAEAAKILDSVNVRLLGLVINRLRVTSMGSTYYDYKPEMNEPSRRKKKLRAGSRVRA